MSQVRDIFKRYSDAFIDYEQIEDAVDTRPQQYDADVVLNAVQQQQSDKHDANSGTGNQMCDSSTCDSSLGLETSGDQQKSLPMKNQLIVSNVQSQGIRDDEPALPSPAAAPSSNTATSGNRIIFQDDQGFLMENVRQSPMNFPAVQLQRAVMNKMNGIPPPFAMQSRRLPFPFPVNPQMMGPPPPAPSDLPYMVNGFPAGPQADMRLSAMITDPTNKHSTKEKMRRERIKDCCENLRNMLPKPANCARKIDMATVLELTVAYVKIFQERSSAGVKDECAEMFHSSFQQIMGKRQLPEEEKEPASGSGKQPKAKSQKKDPLHFIDRSNSPKRSSMIFQPSPGANFASRYRYPTMLPPDSVIQTPYTPQMVSHGRNLIPSPYQGVEYVSSMPVGPTTYDNPTPVHPSNHFLASQQSRGAQQGMKQEIMFQEPALPGVSNGGSGGGSDYPQHVQPFHVYNHH